MHQEKDSATPSLPLNSLLRSSPPLLRSPFPFAWAPSNSDGEGTALENAAVPRRLPIGELQRAHQSSVAAPGGASRSEGAGMGRQGTIARTPGPSRYRRHRRRFSGGSSRGRCRETTDATVGGGRSREVLAVVRRAIIAASTANGSATTLRRGNRRAVASASAAVVAAPCAAPGVRMRNCGSGRGGGKSVVGRVFWCFQGCNQHNRIGKFISGLSRSRWSR